MDYPQMQTNISTAINDIYKTAFFFRKLIPINVLLGIAQVYWFIVPESDF